MATLPTLNAASPLDASDDSRLTFTDDTDETLSRALDNTPADFQSMDDLTWTVEYRQVGLDNDTLSLGVRIVNGATILAAADSGGTFQTVDSNVTNTADTTAGPTAFTYVNTGASKATWDGAEVELQQSHTKQQSFDACHIEVDHTAFDGNYSQTVTDRQGQITWAEFETPSEPRGGRVTWAEFETPDPDRQGRVTWAELEAPSEPRQAQVTWAELETPEFDRHGQITWAEFEAPNEARSGRVTWAEFEAPNLSKSGTRTAPSLALSGTVEQSFIGWESDEPDNTTITIETSLDGGSTWTEVSNGQAIPGLHPGRNMNGLSLEVRQTLESTNFPEDVPVLERLTVSVHPKDGEELVPLGVFGISDSKVSDTGEKLTVAIKGFDRARKVSRARLTEPYVISSGTNYATAIKDLIDSRVSGLSFSFLVTSRVTPLIVLDTGTDPWKAARQMAKSLGASLYFNAAGVCVLEPVPDASETPISVEYEEGTESTILSVEKALEDERTYNVAVVTGEALTNDSPVTATAKDTDPDSPTYVNGDYGEVPIFFKSNLIVTADQAQDAADALLRRSKGGTERVSLQIVPNPSHDVGDVIRVVRDRANVNARYLIDSLTIPLNVDGAMQIKTRQRRTS